MCRGEKQAKSTEASVRKSNDARKCIAAALAPPPSAVSVLYRLYTGRGGEAHKEEDEKEERGEEQHLSVHPAAPHLYMSQRIIGSCSSSGDGGCGGDSSSSDMRWCAYASTWMESCLNL